MGHPVDKQEDITEGKHQKCNGAQIGSSQSVQPRPKDRQMNGHWIL